MTNQKLGQAINLDIEIVALNDLLDAASNNPYLNFRLFTNKDRTIIKDFLVKEEELVYEILKAIKDRKIELERKLKAL